MVKPLDIGKHSVIIKKYNCSYECGDLDCSALWLLTTSRIGLSFGKNIEGGCS
jgi:hypothetical protein